ncbi:MAG: hypothetical protein JJU45_12360 [Acidimicrobiia bacterium]|nr:hypothetical protein [Acidimicrobiia bacterium]
MSEFFRNRHALRRTAAAICGMMAAGYLAIAAGVAGMESTEDMNIVVFGIGAASIFLVGAALLLALDKRPLWAFGAVMQVMIAAMYLAVSSDRDPAFEAWGIGLRVLQVLLLVLLVLLAVRPVRAVRAEETPAAPDTSTTSSVR